MASTPETGWTNATWTPTWGGALTSPGCANCYALVRCARLAVAGGAYQDLFRNTPAGPRWTGKVAAAESAPPVGAVLMLRYSKGRNGRLLGECKYDEIPARHLPSAPTEECDRA